MSIIRSPLKWIALGLFCAVLLVACGNPDAQPTRRTQLLMGTLVEITISHADADVLNAAVSEAFDEMQRIEKLMSTHIPDSEISRINQSAGGKPVSVSPEVREVVRAGIQWAELTQGAFDITIQPVVRLWDFDGGKEEIPRPEAVQQAAGRVNYRDIELTNDSIRLARRGMALNVGGLAKGYAVDRAVAILKRHVPNGIINAGGDLYAFGRKSPQKPWSIGLQHPRKTQDLLASFELTDRAVATSGDYQRYFIKDGVRYHHIFDPQTGMPARGITSVTVLASKVMDADALSTAVFVMGPDKGLEWIDDRANAEAMVVLEDGSIRYSEGFRDQPKFALK